MKHATTAIGHHAATGDFWPDFTYCHDCTPADLLNAPTDADGHHLWSEDVDVEPVLWDVVDGPYIAPDGQCCDVCGV